MWWMIFAITDKIILTASYWLVLLYSYLALVEQYM